jgi:hypothetical protein
VPDQEDPEESELFEPDVIDQEESSVRSVAIPTRVIVERRHEKASSAGTALKARAAHAGSQTSPGAPSYDESLDVMYQKRLFVVQQDRMGAEVEVMVVSNSWLHDC